MFTETIVRRQQISLNDLDDGSSLLPSDYRITGSDSSSTRLRSIQACFIRTTPREFAGQQRRAFSSHGVWLTVMNEEDSRMIDDGNTIVGR